MPKIPSFNRSPSLSPRTGTQSFTQGATAEGEAVARFGEQFSRVVGGVADKIDKANDAVNEAELRTEFRSRLNQASKEISLQKDEDAADGSDVVARASQAFTSIQDDILSKARSSRVKESLILQGQRLASSFESASMDIAQKRYQTHLLEGQEKYSNELSKRVIEDPTSIKEVMEEYDEFLSPQEDDVLGVELKKKSRRAHVANIQRAFEAAHFANNGETANEYKDALMGKSKDEAANELFKDMNAAQRQSALNRVDSKIKQRARINMSNTNLMLDDYVSEIIRTGNADVNKFQSLLPKPGELDGLRPEIRKRHVDNIKGWAEAAKNFSDSRSKSLQELRAMSANPFSNLITVSEYNSAQRSDIAGKLKKIIDSRIEKIEEDVVGVIHSDNPTLLGNRNLENPDEMKKYLQDLRAHKEAMGVENSSVISHSEAMGIGAELNEIKGMENKGLYMDNLVKAYGEDSSYLLEDLKKRNVVSGQMLSYVYMGRDNISKQKIIRNEELFKRGDLTEQNLKDKGKDVASIEKSLTMELDSKWDMLQGNSGLAPLFDQIKESVRREAYHQVLFEGKSESKAVANAVEAMMGSDKFIIEEMGASKIFAPKPANYNKERVEEFFDLAEDEDFIMKMKLDYDNKDFESYEQFVEQNIDNLFFQTDPKDTNYVQMFIRTPSGGINRVTRGGNQVRISIEDISKGADEFVGDIDEEVRPWLSAIISSRSNNRFQNTFSNRINMFTGEERKR